MRSSAARTRLAGSAQPRETGKTKQTLAALRQLLDGDEREHRRTFTQLRRSLDASRSRFRRLFESE